MVRRFLVTVVLTVVATIGSIAGYLYDNGNIEIVKEEEQHNMAVIVDGTLVQDKYWTTVNGYSISINLMDGTYIGR